MKRKGLNFHVVRDATRGVYLPREPFLILLIVLEEIFDSDGCTPNIRRLCSFVKNLRQKQKKKTKKEKKREKNVIVSGGETEGNIGRRAKRACESFVTLMHFNRECTLNLHRFRTCSSSLKLV